jgi:hypothetical protein
MPNKIGGTLKRMPWSDPGWSAIKRCFSYILVFFLSLIVFSSLFLSLCIVSLTFSICDDNSSHYPVESYVNMDTACCTLLLRWPRK